MTTNKKKSGGKDLTVSQVDRQNILNNPYALQEIEKAAHIRGIPFEGKSVVLKEQVATFFEVTPRTVDNYIEKNGEELRQNGYEVIRGKRLKELKLRITENDVNETDFVNIKTPQLGVFDFRAFLNLAMLMTESKAARLLRQAALDIVIDTINRQTGGGTHRWRPGRRVRLAQPVGRGRVPGQPLRVVRQRPLPRRHLEPDLHCLQPRRQRGHGQRGRRGAGGHGRRHLHPGRLALDRAGR